MCLKLLVVVVVVVENLYTNVHYGVNNVSVRPWSH